MMDGIEIINQTVTNVNSASSLIFGFMVLLFIISAIGVAITTITEERTNPINILITLISCLAVILSFGHIDNIERTEYQVTISDEVNFTEFNDKYEIISQEGNIYTITEKEIREDK